jgi:hypothetical protein
MWSWISMQQGPRGYPKSKNYVQFAHCLLLAHFSLPSVSKFIIKGNNNNNIVNKHRQTNIVKQTSSTTATSW